MRSRRAVLLVALAALWIACDKDTVVEPENPEIAAVQLKKNDPAPVGETQTDGAEIGGDVLYACYNPSGSVYRIRTGDLDEECHSPRHVMFSWNAEGPPGPAGADGENGADGEPGISGFERVESPFESYPPSGVAYTAHAECPEGKVALGGGWVQSFSCSSAGGCSAATVYVSIPQPAVPPTGGSTGAPWRWTVSFGNHTSRTIPLRVYATCAYVSE